MEASANAWLQFGVGAVHVWRNPKVVRDVKSLRCHCCETAFKVFRNMNKQPHGSIALCAERGLRLPLHV
jgi:hypothetical protein